MDTFETSATVQEQGRLIVGGLRFAPGTKVDVVINPIESTVTAMPAATVAGRAEKLLNALDKAPNTKPIGSLQREGLYDRDVLH